MARSRSKAQDKENTQNTACGVCSAQSVHRQLWLRALNFVKESEKDWYSTHVISWACPACGQKYATVAILSNLPLKESPSSPMINFAKHELILKVLDMRETLRGIFSGGLSLAKDKK